MRACIHRAGRRRRDYELTDRVGLIRLPKRGARQGRVRRIVLALPSRLSGFRNHVPWFPWPTWFGGAIRGSAGDADVGVTVYGSWSDLIVNYIQLPKLPLIRRPSA